MENEEEDSSVVVSEEQLRRVEVPGDGSCLFWAVALPYLIQVNNNIDLFNERFERLFGAKELIHSHHVRRLINEFHTSHHNNNIYDDEILRRLVNRVFRHKVVDQMSRCEDQFYERISINDFKNMKNEAFITDGTFRDNFEKHFSHLIEGLDVDLDKLKPEVLNEETIAVINIELAKTVKIGRADSLQCFKFRMYLEAMKSSSSWGGKREMGMMKSMLHCEILINLENRLVSVLENSIIYLFNSQQVHYQFFLIKAQFLLEFIDQNSEENTLKYLKIGVDEINYQNSNGSTLLHFAAKNNYLRSINLLLNQGANTNTKNRLGQTPLDFAIALNAHASIKALSCYKIPNLTEVDGKRADKSQLENDKNESQAKNEKNKINEESVLESEINCNDIDRTVAHTENEIDDVILGLVLAILWHYNHVSLSIVNAPVSGERKQMALHLAAKNHRVKAVEMLLENKAEVNVRDENCEGFPDLTPLHYAAEKGHLDIVKLLIEKGKAEIDSLDSTQGSPFQRAVRFGQLSVVKYLVGIGADINSRDQTSISVLSYAAKAGCLNTVHFLVEKGADINAVDKNGITPLHHAAKSCKWDIVQYLVERGANPNVKSNDDKTALKKVVKAGEWHLAKLLIENGALTEGLTKEQINEVLKRNAISLEGEDAIFNLIVLGNAQLLKNHINKLIENNPSFLNIILPQVYETVYLLNIPISQSASLFIESLIIKGRLFSKRKINEMSLNDDENDIENIKQRISLTINAMNKLQEIYLKLRVNYIGDEFVFVGRFIVQNMQILKNQLHFSYNTLPWIEMQFCLVSFLANYFVEWENVGLYQISTFVLNKARLMKHLMHFQIELQKLKISDQLDNKYPFRNRKEMVDSVVESNSGFKDLYEDYELLRNIYSLNRIESYLNPACLVDLKEGDVLVGEQVILRALQVTGECLKNTIESPNMSDKVQHLLIELAPINVIKIVTSLRDSLSHVEHLHKEAGGEDQSYLVDIQKDLIKLKEEITFISLLTKKQILEIFLKRISECENIEQAKELIDGIQKGESIELDMNDKQNEEFLKLAELIEKFKLEVSDPTSIQQFHIERLDDLVEEYRVRLAHVKHQQVTKMRCIKFLSDLISEDEEIELIRKIARKEIIGLRFPTNQIYANCFEKLLENCYAVYDSLDSRNRNIDVLYREIRNVIEFQARKVKSIDTFRLKMTKETKFDDEVEKMDKMEEIVNNILQIILIETADSEIQKRIEIKKQVFRSKNTLVKYYIKIIEIYNNVINFYDNFIDIFTIIINCFSYLIEFYDLKLTDKTMSNNRFIKLIDEDNFDEFYSELNLKNLITENALKNVVKKIKLREMKIEEIISEFQFDKLIDANKLIDKTLFENLLEGLFRKNKFYDKPKKIKDEVKVESLINKDEIRLLVEEIKRDLSLDESSFKVFITNIQLKLNLGETCETLCSDFSLSKCKTVLNCLRRIDFNFDSFGKLVKDVSKESKVSQLRESFNEFIRSLNIDHSLETQKAFNKTFEKIKNEKIIHLQSYFFEKLEILNKIFPSKMSDIELLYLLKINNIRIAVEMLILNLTETLDELSLFEPNRFYLDDFSPVLVGKNLRNYLAHGDPLINIFPANYHISLINHFRLFQSKFRKDNFYSSDRLIGEVTQINPVQVQQYFQQKLISVANKGKLFSLSELSEPDKFSKLISNPVLLKVRDILGNTLLHISAQANNLGVFQYLLQQGLSIFRKNMSGRSVLHSAVTAGSERIIEFLLNKGFDSSFIVEGGYTLLHLAAHSGQLNIVKLLMRYGANIEVVDNEKSKPIFDAVRGEHHNIVIELLKGESDLEWKNKSGQTLMHLAASNVEILKTLLERKVNLNALDHDLNTPLHLACSSGKEDSVKLLLDNKANVNITNKDGATAVHYAAQGGYAKLVELLLQGGKVNVDKEMFKKTTALHLGCFYGHYHVVRVLLENGADVRKRDELDATVLHTAAVMGHAHLIDLLIDYHAEIDCLREGETALHVAAENGASEVFKKLIDKGANIYLKGMDGMSVLHIASLYGHVKMIELILDKESLLGKSDLINEKDSKGRTALHLAVHNNKIEAANFLIEKHAELDAKDFKNRTALFYSAVKGHADIFNILLSKGANINVKDDRGWSLVHAAASNNNRAIANTLIKRKMRVDIESDSGSVTALHLASQNGHLEMVEFLLKNGAQIGTTDEKGWTALHFASLNGHFEIVDCLLKKNKKKDFINSNSRISLPLAPQNLENNNNMFINLSANNGSTALHVAAGHGHAFCVNLLIEKGANVNAAASEKWTALHLAAEKGHNQVVKALVCKGANVNAKGENGSTALHVAARANFVEVVETLLENGADINSIDANRQTALHFCSSLGHEDTALILLKHGADVDAVNAIHWRSLHCAANIANVAIVRALLEHKAEVNAKDLGGWTPLILATHKGHIDVVKLLLAHRAQPNCQVEYGITALHFSIINGFTKIAEAILKCEETDVDLGDFEGRTSLHMAAKYGHTEIVQFLLDNKAKVNIVNKSRATPLHFASVSGHSETAQLLLSRGALVDCVMEGELTPLHLAAEKGHLEVLVELIKFGANVHSKTTILDTPLHLAIENNNVNIVSRLLTVESIDVDAKNVNGATPLHFAAFLGHLEIAEMLIKAGANVNSKSKHEYTPLYLAAKSANCELIKLLTENGAEMNATIEDNNTPLDLSAQLGSETLLKKVLLALIKK